MFKIDKLNSTLCNNCVHTTNNDVCTDWSFHVHDLSNIQTISGISHQLMDSRAGYLENYRCVDLFQKLNTSTKAVYVTQLHDVLIMQQNIFKYSGGISKEVVQGNFTLAK